MPPINFKIQAQPNDETCGPTCLQGIYAYYGLQLPVEQLMYEVKMLEDGGTLAVFLGLDALKRGFKATIHSYNLKIFDPTWAALSREQLIDKLEKQLRYKHGVKFTEASQAYMKFLRNGGNIIFEDLSVAMLQRYFEEGTPILAGMSATYLYNDSRELVDNKGRLVHDDIRGVSTGHFVVLTGMATPNKFRIADPYLPNPISGTNYYEADAQRVINSIMLGIVTYDANLLVITK